MSYKLSKCPFCGGASEIKKIKEPITFHLGNRDVKVFFTAIYAACKECNATGKHFYPAFLPEKEARREKVIKNVILSWTAPTIRSGRNEYRHQIKA